MHTALGIIIHTKVDGQASSRSWRAATAGERDAVGFGRECSLDRIKFSGPGSGFPAGEGFKPIYDSTTFVFNRQDYEATVSELLERIRAECPSPG